MSGDREEDLLFGFLNNSADVSGLLHIIRQHHQRTNESSQEVSEQELEDYIRGTLGEQHLEYSTLLPLSIIYSLFFVLGVLGNLATCLVIIKNEYMRTTTNIYLFNLALADLGTLVLAMPAELYLMWRQYPWTFGEVLCDVKVVITETLIYASILTIVAFTIERYQAICHPLSLNSRSGAGRAKRMILLVWVVSLVSALPWSLFAKVNYIKYKGRDLEQSAWCSMPYNEEAPDNMPLYVTVAATFLYFVIPFTIVLFLYLRIGLTMKRSKMQRCAASTGGSGCEAESSYSQGRRTVIRMLIVVVVAFFICWTPFHSQRLLFVVVTLYGSWTERLQQVQHVLFMVSGVFYYFNSILNPILYTILSKRFRRGFSDISGKCWVYQKFAKAVSKRSKEESSLDQELAEFNLVIKVEGNTTNYSGVRVKHFMSKERREKILKRAKQSYDRKSSSYDHHKAATLPSNPVGSLRGHGQQGPGRGIEGCKRCEASCVKSLSCHSLSMSRHLVVQKWGESTCTTSLPCCQAETDLTLTTKLVIRSACKCQTIKETLPNPVLSNIE